MAEATPRQPPPVLAGVDVFGSAKVPAADVLAEAGLELGGPADLEDQAFLARLGAIGDRLRARFGFAFVKVSPVNYFGGANAGKTYVTIDLVDAGDEARLRFAAEPGGSPEDPAGLVAAWIEAEKLAWEYLQAGTLDVGKCRGGFHCAWGFGHPDLAPREERFIAEVPGHFAALSRVLTEDRVETHRAAAAFLLAYGSDRAAVVAALVPATRDSSELVRNNALRVMVMLQDGTKTEVLPIDPLLTAMHFPVVSDRNKAAYAIAKLVALDPAPYRSRVLADIGDELVQMTAMSQPNNRDPAVAILEALSGQKLGADNAAWRAWLDGQRTAAPKTKTRARPR